jgi:transposase-like protein
MELMASKKPPTLNQGTGSEIRKASTAAARLEEKPRGTATRVYTPEFKLRILREVEQFTASGEYGAVGAFLRREKLQWSAVHRWRKTLDEGDTAALSPKRPGRKPTRDASAAEIERLQKQVAKLEQNLRKAEIIIDVQKNYRRCWVWRYQTRTRRRSRDLGAHAPRAARWCRRCVRRTGSESCGVLSG